MVSIDLALQEDLVAVLIRIPRMEEKGIRNNLLWLLKPEEKDAVKPRYDDDMLEDLRCIVHGATALGKLDVVVKNARKRPMHQELGVKLDEILERIRPERREVDFAIITALDLECQAVVCRLQSHKIQTFEATDIRTYHRGVVPTENSNGSYEIVVVLLPSMGNEPSTAATTDVIQQFNPSYVLMVGIAGGIPQDDLALGDVVVADQIILYEYAKETEGESMPRHRVYPASSLLLERVRNFWDARWATEVGLRRPKGAMRLVPYRNCQLSWLPRRLRRPKGAMRLVPKHFVGPIATGSKIVASRLFRENLVAQWPKLHAVEMESGGVAVAAWQRPHPLNWLVVRGISDWADPGKNVDQGEGWREYAANSAAAYVMAFLRSRPVEPAGSASPR